MIEKQIAISQSLSFPLNGDIIVKHWPNSESYPDMAILKQINNSNPVLNKEYFFNYGSNSSFLSFFLFLFLCIYLFIEGVGRDSSGDELLSSV